jgi:hypothetical protein
VEDEGRPFGVALRGEAPNRPLLHWLKTVVVSDVGKGALDVSGGDQEDDGCRRVETYKDDIETGVSFRSREEPGGCPPTGQAVSGMEAT